MQSKRTPPKHCLSVITPPIPGSPELVSWVLLYGIMEYDANALPLSLSLFKQIETDSLGG